MSARQPTEASTVSAGAWQALLFLEDGEECGVRFCRRTIHLGLVGKEIGGAQTNPGFLRELSQEHELRASVALAKRMQGIDEGETRARKQESRSGPSES